MTKIGIIPMSAKPFHGGHDSLIRLAADECDAVKLFVSLSDREIVSGKAMEIIWKTQIEPTLPENVDIVYGGSPVTNAYDVLGKASEAYSEDTFVIYSDESDAKRFDDVSLQKYAPNINIEKRPVGRTSTVDVSGTKMRNFMATGDKESFIKFLPKDIDGEFVWNTLMSIPGSGKKKKKTNEAMLKIYIRGVVRSIL